MVVSGNVCRAVGGGTGFYRAFTHGRVYERRAWETLAHVRLVVRASIARLRAWLSSFVSRLRSAQRSARAETAGKHDLSARPGRARRPVSGAFPAQPQLRAHLTATGTAVERPPAHSDVRTLDTVRSAQHGTLEELIAAGVPARGPRAGSPSEIDPIRSETLPSLLWTVMELVIIADLRSKPAVDSNVY